MAGTAHHLRAAASNLMDVDADTIKSELQALRSELDRMLGVMKDQGSTALTNARKQGNVAVDHLTDRAGALAEDIGERGQAQIEVIGRRIRAQPMLAAGVAFGAGLLLGALFARR